MVGPNARKVQRCNWEKPLELNFKGTRKEGNPVTSREERGVISGKESRLE